MHLNSVHWTVLNEKSKSNWAAQDHHRVQFSSSAVQRICLLRNGNVSMAQRLQFSMWAQQQDRQQRKSDANCHSEVAASSEQIHWTSGYDFLRSTKTFRSRLTAACDPSWNHAIDYLVWNKIPSDWTWNFSHFCQLGSSRCDVRVLYASCNGTENAQISLVEAISYAVANSAVHWCVFALVTIAVQEWMQLSHVSDLF